jgi:hypothetical protein
VSIEELWTEMDMMDAISHGGTSAGNVLRSTHHKWRSVPLVLTTGICTSHTDKRALLDDTPGPSNAPSRGHGRGHGKYSTKNKAAQILFVAPEAISPWRLFVDRQYSPSTRMDVSEWEIILDELTRMGYIVKIELDSDGNE